MQSIIGLLNHYGYIVLLVALILELIAFPLPGEVLMTYCGFLVNEQKLNWLLSIMIASSGAIIGITISYFIGNILGVTFFKKHGHYIHLNPDRLDKTSMWFNKYGNRLLLISYFIPGVRHITGYFSGITEISYRKFALNSYIGAFLWTTTFISLGKVLGVNWEKYHSVVTRYLIIGGLIISLIIILIYLYRNYKDKIIEFTIRALEKSIKIFNSFGKIKLALAGVALVFLIFCGLVIGIIQDYLAHEFSQFDSLTSLLVKLIFTQKWMYTMKLFGNLTSYKILIPFIILISIWIVFKGVDRFLEIRFMFLAILGGEVLQFVLRNIFRRMGPSGLSLMEAVKYTFPSKQALLAIVIYGFISFIIIRHSSRKWLGSAAVVMALAICFFAGLSPLFFQTEYPSDIFAGYVFGVVWLALNIILLEVYRILPKIK